MLMCSRSYLSNIVFACEFYQAGETVRHTEISIAAFFSDAAAEKPNRRASYLQFVA
jgi:hypothetical protein